jgi:hypothetical protein
MESKTNPDKPADTDPSAHSTASIEAVLRPFQDASARFLQASVAARDAAMRQQARAWLDLQEAIRRAELEAHLAAIAVARKHLDQMEQQSAGGAAVAASGAAASGAAAGSASAGASPEEAYAVRARAQADYEQEIRQIYANTQAKLAAAQQQAFTGGTERDPARQMVGQQQNAYQAYLAEMQQAWAGAQGLDPQTMNAIATNILYTIQAANRGG